VTVTLECSRGGSLNNQMVLSTAEAAVVATTSRNMFDFYIFDQYTKVHIFVFSLAVIPAA
jgi:hypothetical protein